MATFKEAFAKALAEKGTGQTFTWNGKKYTTDLASGKTMKPKENPQVSDMAGKGNDKTVAPKASIRPKSRTSVAQNANNKPTVSSTAPTQPKAPVNAPLKVKRTTTVKATGSATSNTGIRSSAKPVTANRNVAALKGGVAKAVAAGKELLTTGSVTGSAYRNRMDAKARYKKAAEQALFDQRLANAESDISGASRSTKGKVKKGIK